MKSELAPATQAKVLELRVVKGQGSKPSRKVGATEQIDDKVLVERAARGDGIAFSELVNRHYEKAVRVSFGMLKDRFDAEDVAQEAFARVYRKLESFEGQSAFSTWLYRIVVNLSIDSLRKRKRQRRADVDDEMTREALRSDEELWPVFDQADPMLSVERRELRARLDAAFAELPEIHRAVLVLREVQGLSYEEIADALEIKKGTVMSRLFHARKAMQKLLTQDQGAEVV
jgi:RNA polymerase sigma-70 factor (ECF subfamily)